MKKVLMVAHHFPPDGSSSGVLRALKFSKYLPQHGWIPHVLTLKESAYAVKDPGLLRDIPTEAVIHRTFALDSARHLAIKGRHLVLLATPDRFVSWVLFGGLRGLRVIRKTRIQAIYSTSPPPSAHLIGAVLKVITGIPWVADFRDPWIEEGLHPRPGTLRYRVESAMERVVVRSADRLIVTTPYFRTELLSRYPEVSAGKIEVIYNGYDEADFEALHTSPRSDRFEIIHAGLVTPEFRDPSPLFEALATLFANGILPREQVQITFLGGSSYVESPAFAAAVDRAGLRGVVHVADRVPHHQAIQLLRQAAALLLLQASDDTRSLIPAKAFEYLRIGQPILALTLEGATADLLKETECCYVVNPSDQAGLRHAVIELFRLWRQHPSGIHVKRSIERYERSNLTAELARVLEDICGTIQGTRQNVLTSEARQ